jgi:dienelactone hydrolase
MVDLTGQLPTALRQAARWERLTKASIPVMMAHPDWASGTPVPTVLWMHGRTAAKEIDPGRYLRWIRNGMAAIAIDLPGHGERHDERLQQPENTLEVIVQMVSEIDTIVDALAEFGVFDTGKLGIGGMSAGGMATMVRLCRDHPFLAASVEATTGSWERQHDRAMFRGRSRLDINQHNPLANLSAWREIPFQAIHAQHDEWVNIELQREFIGALRKRYANPDIVELIEYDRTGAPFEHSGFGRMAADAKQRQLAFFRRWLLGSTE